MQWKGDTQKQVIYEMADLWTRLNHFKPRWSPTGATPTQPSTEIHLHFKMEIIIIIHGSYDEDDHSFFYCSLFLNTDRK